MGSDEDPMWVNLVFIAVIAMILLVALWGFYDLVKSYMALYGIRLAR